MDRSLGGGAAVITEETRARMEVMANASQRLWDVLRLFSAADLEALQDALDDEGQTQYADLIEALIGVRRAMK